MTQTTGTRAKKQAATPLQKALAAFLAHLSDMERSFPSFLEDRALKARFAEDAVGAAVEHLRFCTESAKGGGRGVY